MKTLAALLIATMLVAFSSACRSTHEDVPCTCGTALGDLEGCENSYCRDGKTNPDNPNCVCGGIEIPTVKKQQ
jgi:hypothetical protein